jgi:hypothetical protein
MHSHGSFDTLSVPIKMPPAKPDGDDGPDPDRDETVKADTDMLNALKDTYLPNGVRARSELMTASHAQPNRRIRFI